MKVPLNSNQSKGIECKLLRSLFICSVVCWHASQWPWGDELYWVGALGGMVRSTFWGHMKIQIGFCTDSGSSVLSRVGYCGDRVQPVVDTPCWLTAGSIRLC